MHRSLFAGTAAIVAAFSIVLSHSASAGSDEAPFTKAELQEFLTGKTYPLSKGAFYFESGDTLVALWKGDTETTTWWATDDSRCCYNLKNGRRRGMPGAFKEG